MSRLSFLLAVLVVSSSSSFSQSSPSSAKSGDGWKLVWADEFETAGTPNPKNWKVDDALLNTVMLSETINKDGTSINPFRQPHYLLVNLAIGGDNGGDPSATAFPNRYEIDYVRVYQK